MMNLQYEISRTPPPGAPALRLTDGIPILYAYDCALLENDLGDYLIYKAVNLDTRKSVIIGRRKNPLEHKDIEKTVERIRNSGVAGAARLEADRPYGARITFEKCREILYAVFKDILPRYGYTVRKEQIALADSILKNINDRKTALAEAEVGTGKTHAYIIAAIIAKRGRLMDFWNKGFYPKMAYADMAQMPIVIATSSIALQKAIIKDYIPELSRILLENGVIKTPLTAVLRKGREHYVCDRYLQSHYISECDNRMKAILKDLLKPVAMIDLAEITGLTAHVKRQIRVPSRCSLHCPNRDSCRYLSFISKAMNPAIDIQVTNHNYMIADALHRSGGKRPLLPNYQTVIIDEAHKLLSAARSMYGTELSSDAAPSMIEYLSTIQFDIMSAGQAIRVTAKKLFDESRRLFRGFAANMTDDAEDDAERFCAEIDKDATRHLRNIRDIADKLYEQLASEPVDERHLYRKSQLLWEINQIRERAAVFALHREHICWLERPSDSIFTLCSIPKDLDKRLFADFWGKGIPTVLTSGTLSAGGDFSHTKRTLGLDMLKNRITETSKPSPFNHRDNAMLYISESMPFPDGKNKGYISAITDEIERLIRASHGHAAVLFTSYDTMGRVHAALYARNLPFPLMRLERGSSAAIEKFKQTKCAVLFASGSLWEGIDIPGDALSMLIIVKLPFQVPDPIGEYEQTLYKDMFEYKTRVVVPEMLLKLKQGFGRLIRTEKDTGCVAILDSRVNSNGAYRECVLDALPDCRVTDNMDDVVRFYDDMKPPEYFINQDDRPFSQVGKRGFYS
jgi:ATP-dependent DNA helicase DinG